jgi:hypothetical protein
VIIQVKKDIYKILPCPPPIYKRIPFLPPIYKILPCPPPIYKRIPFLPPIYKILPCPPPIYKRIPFLPPTYKILPSPPPIFKRLPFPPPIYSTKYYPLLHPMKGRSDVDTIVLNQVPRCTTCLCPIPLICEIGSVSGSCFSWGKWAGKSRIGRPLAPTKPNWMVCSDIWLSRQETCAWRSQTLVSKPVFSLHNNNQVNCYAMYITVCIFLSAGYK